MLLGIRSFSTVSKGLVLFGAAILGNAANRIEIFVLRTGTYAYGSYPDLDALFQQQTAERDRRGARAYALWRMKSATRSAIIMVVALVLARITSGITDASATRSPSSP